MAGASGVGGDLGGSWGAAALAGEERTEPVRGVDHAGAGAEQRRDRAASDDLEHARDLPCPHRGALAGGGSFFDERNIGGRDGVEVWAAGDLVGRGGARVRAGGARAVLGGAEFVGAGHAAGVVAGFTCSLGSVWL